MAVRTAYIGTATALSVLTAANLNKAPGGWIGHAEVTSTESGFGAGPTNIASLSVAVTVGTSRRLKITAKTRGDVSVAANSFKLQIREGSTELGYCEMYFPTNTNGITMIAHAVFAPTSGAHTYVASITRTAGAGSFNSNAGATDPAFILVEDMGPA